MKSSAIAIANYFIDKSLQEKKDITLLFLVKLVYLAHGYLLALLDDGGFDKLTDKVEAWRYGPVIPSVYHTFKNNRANPIKIKGLVLEETMQGFSFIEPEIIDKDAKTVLDFVWNRYKNYSVDDIMALTHRADTPWAIYYRANKNVEIPDESTRLYYKMMLEAIKKISK